MLTQEISVEDKAANDKDDIIGKSERGYAVEDAQQLHQQRRTLRQQIEGTGFLLRTLLQSSNLSVTDNQQANTAAIGNGSSCSVSGSKHIDTSELGGRILPAATNAIVHVKRRPLFTAPFYGNFSTIELVQTIEEPFKQDEKYRNNFLKGCKWSPDGMTLMACSEDRKIRCFPIDSDKYSNIAPTLLSPNASVVGHGELVYDYCWYPLEWKAGCDSAQIDGSIRTSVFASTSRDHPIHLWDCQLGSQVATYRAINHLDELSSAHSLCFSNDGQRMYAGYVNLVRVFDLEKSSRQISTIKLYDKGSCYGSCAGIISCIANNPASNGCYAFGSYSKFIALYSELSNSFECIVCSETSGGISNVSFSRDGIRLYSSSRKDDSIMCWDMRHLGKTLFTVNRPVDTNQRIYFDVDPSGRYLISGDRNGRLQCWDVSGADPILVQSVQTNRCHINGVSFNGRWPLLASSSGERVLCSSGDSHMRSFCDALPSTAASASSDDSESSDVDAEDARRCAYKYANKNFDNNLKLWRIL